jgi:lysosomal acid lipase/cholesteryl ester hydrolase
MQDGSTWFMNSPEQNLPMILADNGFDVWVVNARGTKFSRKHTSLDTSSEVRFFLNNHIFFIYKV